MPHPLDTNREQECAEQKAFYWPLNPDWQEKLPPIPDPTRLKIRERVNSIVICVKPAIAWRSITTVVGGSFLVTAAVWLIAYLLQGPHAEAERWNFNVQVAALLVSLIPGLVAFLYLTISFFISEELVIDEHGLQLGEVWQRVFVPNSQLLATRPVFRSSRHPQLNTYRSRWLPLSFDNAGFLDIVTPNGVLRLLEMRRIEDIRWLSKSLAVIWSVPEEDELDVTCKRSDHCRAGRTVLIAERPTRRWRHALTWCLLLVILLFDLMFFWYVPVGIASDQWPSTDGLVIRAELNVTGSGLDRNSDVQIEYTYEVGDEMYQGDRLWFAIRSNTWELEDLAAAHPPGSIVDVYYDPSDPSRAVLLPGVPNETYIGLSVPALVLPVIVMLWLIRLSPEQERLHHMYVRKTGAQSRRRTRR